VFKNSAASAASSSSSSSSSSINAKEPDDDFYDLTPEDYHRIASLYRKRAQGHVLKTRKLREAEVKVAERT